MGIYKTTIVLAETAKRVYESLKKCEPYTPNEIAKALGLDQKTVQSILLELAYRKGDVKLKKIGRYRLFWRTLQRKEKGEA